MGIAVRRKTSTRSGLDALQVCKVRCPISNLLEIVDGQRYIGGSGHCQEVKNLCRRYMSHYSKRSTNIPTAFVEPPNTLIMTMAFKKELRVRISLARNIQHA